MVVVARVVVVVVVVAAAMLTEKQVSVGSTGVRVCRKSFHP